LISWQDTFAGSQSRSVQGGRTGQKSELDWIRVLLQIAAGRAKSQGSGTPNSGRTALHQQRTAADTAEKQ